jgi:hypothetical protein
MFDKGYDFIFLTGIGCKTMRHATRLVDGFKQGLQFLKGSAGDANNKSLARKSLGNRATCCIAGPYDQANF